MSAWHALPAPEAAAPSGPGPWGRGGNTPRSERHSSQDKPAPATGGMAALFANAKQLKK